MSGYDNMRRGYSKRERITVFYDRLAAAPAAESADDALKLIDRLLTEVEDELSGIAERSPPPPFEEDDGRMYPPQADRITRHGDGSLTAQTAKHVIEIGSKGAIRILRRRGRILEFAKDGVL